MPTRNSCRGSLEIRPWKISSVSRSRRKANTCRRLRSWWNEKEPVMKRTAQLLMAFFLVASFDCAVVRGSERYFTYSYEPEAMPQGVAEFEQWVTLRAVRDKEVGQEHYNQWELREEFEYGVTDRYTLSLYLNTVAESFRDSTT